MIAAGLLLLAALCLSGGVPEPASPASPAPAASVPVPPAPPVTPPVPVPGAPPPSSASAIIVPARPAMVLGTEQEMPLEIRIAGADATALRLERAVASVGALHDVAAAGPDRLRARYVAPPTRFPQVAILVVDLVGPTGQRLRALARLPLHATTEIPFRTNPGTGVTIRIGDRQFGPVRADEQGRVAVPVVVPPGVREGSARAVDRSGGTRDTVVDLQPAPFPRLLIVAVAEAEVGSFIDVSVLAVDPQGAALPAGRLALKASDGLVHPLGPAGAGEERFLLEVPRHVAAGPVTLVATTTADAPSGHGPAAPAAPARAEAAIALLAGPAEKLAIAAPANALVIGDGGSATVTLTARDRMDNPTSCRGAAVLVDGAPAAMEILPRGEGAIVVRAPATFTGKRELEVKASLGAASVTARVHLTAGPAARLAAVFAAPRLVADGRASVDVLVSAQDRHGTPASAGSLRWHAPGGRVSGVQIASDGTYLARFTPNRAREAHAETLVILGEPSPVSTTATLAVEPPRMTAAVTARVGLFSSFGSSAGPEATLEALSGIPGHAAWAAGVSVSYLRNDFTTGSTAPGGLPTTRVELDQLPIMGLVRYHLPLPVAADVAVGLGAGVATARVTLTSPPSADPQAVRATAHSPAFEGGTDVAFPLAPGELVVGMRYVWINLGRTSHGDQISGNGAGLVGDVGFRMTW